MEADNQITIWINFPHLHKINQKGGRQQNRSKNTTIAEKISISIEKLN